MKKILFIIPMVALFTIFSPAFGQQKYSRKELSRKNDTLSAKTMELNQKISSLEDQIGKLKKDQGDAASSEDLYEVERKTNEIGNSVSRLYEDIDDMRATIALVGQTTNSTAGQDSALNSQAEKIVELQKSIAEIGQKPKNKTLANNSTNITKKVTGGKAKMKKDSLGGKKNGKSKIDKNKKKPALSVEKRLSALEEKQLSVDKKLSTHLWWLSGISLIVVIIIFWFRNKSAQISKIQTGIEELLSRRTN